MSTKPIGSETSALASSQGQEEKPKPPSSEHPSQDIGRSSLKPYKPSNPIPIPPKKKPQ